MGKHLSRRGFLQGTAAVMAAPFILPARARGANSRVNVGIIGVGRRAGQLTELPEDAPIVAIADVHRGRLEEWTKPRERRDWRTFQDYREMLAQSDIDAVIIATPDHWHALNAIHAMEAGKDVYCEKPMTLTVREGRLMADCAKEHGRICQTGSQQRSMTPNQEGARLVQEGAIGTVETVHTDNFPSPWECDLPAQETPEGLDWDMWCGPTEPRPYHLDLYLPRAEGRRYPDGRPYGWISYRPYSGGEMTGWGTHGLDVIQWALGMDDSGPVEVWPEDEGLTAPVTFRYANGVTVHCDGEGPAGGGLFVGDEGRIRIDRGQYQLRQQGGRSHDTGRSSENTQGHLAHWIDCIRSRERPNTDVEVGHRTTTMCHLGNIARWTGRRLQWDPAAERFVDDADANTHLTRAMRAPWAL